MHPLSTYRLQIRAGFRPGCRSRGHGIPPRPRGRRGPTSRRCCRRPRGRITATTWSTPGMVDPARGGPRGARALRRRRARGAGSASWSTSSRTTWGWRQPAREPLVVGRADARPRRRGMPSAFDIDWDFGGGQGAAADPRRPTLDEAIGDIRVEPHPHASSRPAGRSTTSTTSCRSRPARPMARTPARAGRARSSSASTTS